MKTVILVSPHFPPSMLAGVHRARHLAKHLPAAGWKPIVIAVHERHHCEKLDPALAGLVPPDVGIVRTGALPVRLTRPFGVGDIGIRAYASLRSAVLRVIHTERPAAVLITGSPFYPMMIAPAIRQRGISVILDFQDPWVSAWGARQPPRTKAGLAHGLAKRLEPIAVRAASAITSVSDTQNGEMAARYRWIDRDRMFAIPIGGDADDFAALRAREAPAVPTGLDPKYLNFSYVGTFLPRAGSLFRTFFKAVASLRNSNPSLASRMRFHFIGTSNQPNDFTTHAVRTLAADEGVCDLVRETPQRLPFLDALGILVRSHGVLLLGSDEPHYTASKIYPALMSGRPYLSLFHRASSAHTVLASAGGGIALAFEGPSDLAALEGPMREALARLASSPDSLGRVDPAAYAPFEAAAIARRFADVFERAASIQ